uniref:phosphoinositide 5-phosphatase n=1 Tax=Gongylonema pulchrum TaxID=637853 RepID=A0A183E6S9_9BILA
LGSSEVSFLQIRGSVPLFWEQPGINVGSHKAHYKNSHCAVDYIAFDYHEEKRNCLKLIDRLKATILKCMFFCRRNGSLICTQNGVIRVNCLDCLDRTNAVQTLIGFQVARFHFGIFRIVPLILQSYEVLTSQLESLQVDRKYISRFEEHLKDIWQRNGDACSVIYAGTGALEGKSKVKDARRTLVRTIQNNFLDSSKQEAFDFLLHGASIYDCFFRQVACMLPRDIIQKCPPVAKELAERKHEMVDSVPLTVWVGTWNVNGGKNFSDIAFRNQTNLADWLFPEQILGATGSANFDADIYIVGLEEIIDLNASNIVSASTTNQRAWAHGLREALSERGKHVLLGSEQLVGVCIFVFIKPSLAAVVRDLYISSVKTGLFVILFFFKFFKGEW